MKDRKVRYYRSFEDDFSQSAHQDYVLPEDYRWVRNDLGSRLLSGTVYALAVLFSAVYCKCFLHMKVKGRKNLKGIRGGCILYGNHTQPVGDVFIPALCLLPRRIYTVVSTANYGIPVIGRILPYLGALPIVSSLRGMKELSWAMEHRLAGSHPIVIYPEAHVWEYCTRIRPFPDTSFKYPVKFHCPAFAMTVTYQRSRIFKKPMMTVFLDGPFYGRGNSAKEQAADLHRQVSDTMQARSRESNFSYIEYRPAD